MWDTILRSPYFGMSLTVLAYWIGVTLQKKSKTPLCNAMIIAVGIIIVVVLALDIPFEAYYVGGNMINTFLIPATACLGVRIYKQLPLLKANLIPVMVGCVVGCITSIISVFFVCKVFGLDRELTVSLLPKSVTTPIAQSIVEGQGGIAAIAAAAVCITGIGGNLLAPWLIKLFRVKEPLAVGLAIGASSHALGTVKALEIGEAEGAMSGLAMGICGVVTATLALSFPYILQFL